jgi:hypothetical protein
MRRKLSLVALVLTAAVVGACSNPAGPARDGDCAVVVGSQTRCEE